MPEIEEELKWKRKIIYLGNCIQQVSVSKIISLLNLAHNKVEVRIDETILFHIMAKDKNFVKMLKEPNSQQSRAWKEEHIFIEMVHKNYSQVVKVMIEHGAKLDVQSKKPIHLPNNRDPI